MHFFLKGWMIRRDLITPSIFFVIHSPDSILNKISSFVSRELISPFWGDNRIRICKDQKGILCTTGQFFFWGNVRVVILHTRRPNATNPDRVGFHLIRFGHIYIVHWRTIVRIVALFGRFGTGLVIVESKYKGYVSGENQLFYEKNIN